MVVCLTALVWDNNNCRLVGQEEEEKDSSRC